MRLKLATARLSGPSVTHKHSERLKTRGKGQRSNPTHHHQRPVTVVPTVAGVHYLHGGGVGELQHRHHGFRQLDLEGLGRLELLVRDDLHPPGGAGLARVELDLLLGLALEVLVLLRRAVLGGDACSGRSQRTREPD